MKFKDEILNKLYFQILSGKLSEASETIRKESLSVPLEILKMGYERSKVNDLSSSHVKYYGKPNLGWFECMSLSIDPRVADFLEEEISNTPYFYSKGLFNLWKLDPERAINIMRSIEKFDPEFENIPEMTRADLIAPPQRMRKGQLSEEEKQKVISGVISATHMFKYILLTLEEKNSPRIIEEFKYVLQNSEEIENKVRDHKKRNTERNRILDRRAILITEDLLTQEQYNRLFKRLWDSTTNIKIDKLPLNKRDAWNLFNYNTRGEGPPYGYKNKVEVKQLLLLLEEISVELKEYVDQMFYTLPFWTEEYRSVDKAMFRFSPDIVISEWKNLLNIDAHIELQTEKVSYSKMDWENERNSQSRGRGRRRQERGRYVRKFRTPPGFNYLMLESEFIYGLGRVMDNLDRDYLFELIDHDNPNIRDAIKKILKNTDLPLSKSLRIVLQELDDTFLSWDENSSKKKN